MIIAYNPMVYVKYIKVIYIHRMKTCTTVNNEEDIMVFINKGICFVIL